MSIRIGLTVLVLSIPILAATPRSAIDTRDSTDSLIELLATDHGLIADPGSLHWIDVAGGGLFNEWTTVRVALAARTDETALRDLYLVHTRIAPTGKAISANPVNLTQSFNAADRALVARGADLMLGTMVDGRYVTLEYFDFNGDESALTDSWSRLEKLKASITNLQKTGQTEGVSRTRYELVTPSTTLALAFDGEEIVTILDTGTMRIRPGSVDPTAGAQLALYAPPTKAISGHVAWMVDTVRAIPMIGSDKIGWLEAKFYNLKDAYMRTFYAVAGDNYAASQLEEELGIEDTKPYVLELPEALGEMNVGWPPQPIPDHPAMDPMEHEGEWSAFNEEPFTRHDPGHPLPFVTTFIRPDPDRSYASLSLVAWDPRMVEIHMQAGVVEPKSDTGKAGTGMIPRDDETMMRLLGAFNGGFQALHGEFGMMQDGKVYLPPKPWAATVARLKGGRIGFGTWPGPEVGAIPPEVLSYRQNLTPLMQDGEINPYRRRWWGSSPDLNPDSPKINRSGICWTEEGHIIYGLAKSVDENGFAEGFKRAGCHYLIQLDVNSGHSGFEFYRVDPTDSAPVLPEDVDKKATATGEVRDRPDLTFRARKMFRKMVLMRFPRFIQRDPRDYFYLTLARNLPTDPPPDTTWQIEGLPGSTTYPARFAMTTVRSGDDPVHVVQSDPRWLFVAPHTPATPTEGGVWFPPATLPAHNGGPTAPPIEPGSLVLGFAHDPTGNEWAALPGRWGTELTADDVQYAFAAVDEQTALGSQKICGAFGLGPDRFLTWVESPGGNPRQLIDALHASGATQVLAIPFTEGSTCGWAFNYNDSMIPLITESLAGWGIALSVFERSPVVRMFPDTSIVIPTVWNPGQTKRIRYFRPVEKPEDDQESN